MNIRVFFLASLVLSISLPVTAQSVAVPNPSFESLTEEHPTDWQLSGGTGGVKKGKTRDGKYSAWVEGTGDTETMNFWRSADLPLIPGEIYSLRYIARWDDHKDGKGCAITGSNFANCDHSEFTNKWEEQHQVFLAPTNSEVPYLRFGQWEATGRLSFDAIRLCKAIPVYRHFGEVILGAGERILGNRYHFAPPMLERHTNHFRASRDGNAYFNTSRFMFGNQQFLTFEHTIAAHPMQSGRLLFWTQHHGAGAFTVAVAKDGKNWTALGAVAEGDMVECPLPASIFPAESLWVQMFASTEGGSITMSGYRIEAVLGGEPIDARGDTQYFDAESVADGLSVTADAPGLFDPSAENGSITLSVASALKKPFETELRVREEKETLYKKKISVNPSENTYTIPLVLNTPGNHALHIDGGPYFQLAVDCFIPEFYNTAYGELLDDSGIWWASSGWKIPRNRALPREKGKALYIETAQNETEAAQLVICPNQEVKGVSVQCADLKGPGGAILSAAQVTILKVGYVPVLLPTDETGVAAAWPDPLIPQKEGITLAAGENQPFWVRVKPLKDTPAGEYHGMIRIEGEGYKKEAPITVRVYPFALPDRMSCESAFGFGLGRAFEYHGAKNREDQAKVADLYLRALADHHINPYNIAPMESFGVTWPDIKPGDTPAPETLRATFDWTRWDAAMERAFNEYHFSTFQLPMEGMGGGTFFSRTDPSLLGFGEDSPIYQALFRDYCVQVEKHLKDKGWLDRAFVYWFDEPEPRDYEFVMKGFKRIKDAAPGIPRMLTEQIEPALVGGPNIWCPISNELKPEETQARQKEGEKIWWYICTGPKAPYATLFIDHPGTELRVWLWQTWERKIQGILIWETLLWTSPSAYPDPNAPQNPYTDPMGWQYGYGEEPGARRPWGNGDGRFLYPPESAANGRPETLVLDPPVDTFRIEMLRDGIEDYEYMVILKKLIEEKGAALTPAKKKAMEELLTVPGEITESTTLFTKDPAPIEKHRRKVAEAIGALSNMK